MKRYYLMAAAALTLTGCTNEYLGGEINQKNEAPKAITFTSGKQNVTRAETTHESVAAAGKLDYSFTVYSYKMMPGVTTPIAVFDSYQVWWDGSASTSNTAGWEYVGEEGQDYGSNTKVTLTKKQTIKYWDEDASYYIFAGCKNLSDKLQMNLNPATEVLAIEELEGATAADYQKIMLADKVKIEKNDYGKPVKFTFRSVGIMVKAGFYETIPGYSVRIDKTYQGDNASDAVVLNGNFTSANAKPTITYNNEGKCEFIYGAENSTASTYNVGPLKYPDTFPDESKRGTYVYPTIGKSASEVSLWSAAAFPHQGNTATEMWMKIDYTLIADDKTSGAEEIHVKGAMVRVPVAYCTWETNHAYTYIFKITDNKLTPITFDAVFVDDISTDQQVITTVDEPSITTYQQGSDVKGNDEYAPGTTITLSAVFKSGQTIAAENPWTYAKVATPITEAEAAKAMNTLTWYNAANNSSVYTVTLPNAGAEKYVVVRLKYKESDTDKYAFKVIRVKE